MKKIISLFLSIVMLISTIACVDLSAYAETIPEYIKYQAEIYAMKEHGFDDIFIGTDSSSFARTYYNDLKNDGAFIASVTAWEEIHIATEPSYSLESGKITKKDFYETILFDMLDTSAEGSLVSEFGNTYSKLFKMIKNENTSFVVSTANKIMGKDGITVDELNTFKYADLSDEAKSLLLEGNKYANVTSVVDDVNKILGYAKSAYEAIEATSNYLSIKEYQQGTKEILGAIATDESNDLSLRLAAEAISTCFDKSFDSVLMSIAEGGFSAIETSLGMVFDYAWKELVSIIPGGSAILLGVRCGRALCNYLFSTDKLVKGYYLLEASIDIEDALIRALESKKSSLNNNPVNNATIYMQGISMYKNIILLGFDYSIDLLEQAANSNFNSSTDFWLGNYSECISLISQIESFKQQKINNYIQYEEVVQKSYKNKYFPNYDDVEANLNNATVLITSMEVIQTKNLNLGDTGSIYDFFSFSYYPENHTLVSYEDGVTSSDENVIAVDKNTWAGDKITAVGEGICTLTFTSNSGNFADSLEVIVSNSNISSDDEWDIGLMYNSDDNTIAYIRGYNGNATNVIVPSSYEGYDVTIINGSIFKDNTTIKSVVMPDSVKTITSNLFSGCTQLQNVTLSSNLKNIPSNTFKECTSLYSIKIPDTVVNIGSGAFYGCTNLVSIVLSGSITSIGEGAFENCKNLSNNMVIPNTVTEIGKNAFKNCTSLKKISISDNVTVIEPCLFYNCSNLKSVKLSNNITSIGSAAFYGCGSLTSISLPSTLSEIDSGAFLNCERLEKIVIPENVIDIYDFAFGNCTSLKNIEILDSGNEINIHEGAFYACSALEYLLMPCSARLYYEYVGQTYYTYFERPSDNYVSSFSGVSNLKKVYLTKGTGKMYDYDTQDYNGGLYYTYRTPWHGNNVEEIIVGEGVEYIGENAFYYCSTEKITILSKDLKTVGKSAFAFCSEIKEIDISSVVTIGDSAFYNCGKLNKVKLGSLVYSNNYAFSGCRNLTDVYFYGNIDDWCNIEFSNYSSNPLDHGSANLYINDLIVSIADINKLKKYTFAGCNSLKEVLISNNVDTIEEGAFDCCYNLTSVIISEGTKKIDSDAFYSCSNLINITIPKSVKNIGGDAFGHCSSLQDVYYAGNEEEWNSLLIGSYNDYLINATIHYNVTEKHEYTVIERVNPSCATNGYIKYACPCGYEKTETIPALGHNDVVKVEIVLPTCNEEGYTVYHCKVCNSDYKDDYTDALGNDHHNYLNGICTVCNDGIADELGIEYDLFNGEARITKYTGNHRELKMPKTLDGHSVVSIESGAFSGCTDLTKIEMPDSIEKIDYSAFKNCTNLKSVALPNNITTISGNYMYGGAFEGCYSLESITIPDSVTSIEEYAFDGCTNLATVNISDKSKLEYVGDHAFTETKFISDEANYKNGFLMLNNCLIKVKDDFNEVCRLPKGITYVPEGSFDNCDQIKIVVLPEGVEEIEYNAFNRCYNIVAIYIPKSLQKIDHWNFSSCQSLLHVLYAGTEEEWKSKRFGDYSGNSYFLNATRHYNVTDEIVSCSVTKEATCLSEGSELFSCSECNFQKELTIDKTNHRSCLVKKVDPVDCNNPGYSVYKCNICGEEYYDDYVYLGHQYEITTIGPTCTKRGYTQYICSVCGDTYDSDFVNALGHNYADGICINCGKAENIITLNSSAKAIINDEDYIEMYKFIPEKSGIYIFFSDSDCDTYGYLYDENMNQLECNDDSGDSSNFLISYSFEEGKTYYLGAKYYSSSNKGEFAVVLTDNYVSRHSYIIDEVVDATCTKQGYTKKKCTYCDDINYEYSSALGHNFIDGICGTCGMLEEDCIESEHPYTNNYDNSWIINKPNAKRIAITFSESTKTESCDYIYLYDSNDNEIGRYSGTELASKRIVIKGDTVKIRLVTDFSVTYYGFALSNVQTYYEDCNHDGETEIRNARTATCSSKGYSGDTYCVECGEIISKGKELPIDVNNHNMQERVVEPTCTEQGYTEYYCFDCDYSYKTVYIPATGIHTYVNGFCKVCKEKDPDCILRIINGGETQIVEIKNGGDYYYVTFTPKSNGTCTFSSTGNYDTYGYLYDENMNVLSSNNDGGENCNFSINYDLQVGRTYIFACGMLNTDETGTFNVTLEFDEKEHVHSYVTKVVNPTCTAKGYTTYTCECGDSYVDNYVNATGHNYDSGKVTKSATCTSTGVKTYTCTVCGATKTETIAKKAHTPVTDKTIAATCTKTGLTEGSHCSVCGTVITAQKTVAKKAHTYKTTTTKATTSKNGSVVSKCSVCGTVKSKSTIYYPKTITLSTTSYTYDGNVKKPTVKVVNSNGKTISSSNYTVTYASGRKNVGKYSVKITFKGNYSGTKTLYFTINPKGTSISSVTAKSKGFTVKWKKQANQTTGYEIQYATDSKFTKNKKTVIVSKNSTTSKTISKLSAKKKYYVRIRTYKTVKINGKSTKIYSSWSKAKTITTK